MPSSPIRLVSALLVVAGLSAAPRAQELEPAPSEPRIVPSGSVSSPTAPNVSDIETLRVEHTPYVLRHDERVVVDLGPIDLEADVIMTITGPDGTEHQVTRDEYRRRAIMYMGEGEVDQRITQAVTLIEVDRRVAEDGASRDDFLLSAEDVDAKLDELQELVRMNSLQQAAQRGVDAESEEAVAEAEKSVRDFLDSIQSSVGMEAYRELLSADAAFEKVFLPVPAEATGEETWDYADGPVPEDYPKPDWMPQVTWDALSVDESSRNLRNFVKDNAASGTEIPAFFKQQIIARIRLGVMGNAGVTFFFDGDLPDGVFLRVGDHDILTDELWVGVKDNIVDADRDLIVRELLTLRACEDALRQAGAWLDDDTYASAFREYEKQFEGTLFPLGAIIMFRGYTSTNRFREHYRFRECFTRMRKEAPEATDGTSTFRLTEEEIEDHYRKGGRLFFERGSILVDLAYRGVSTFGFDEEAFDEAEAELLAGYAEAQAAAEAAAEDEVATPDPWQDFRKAFPIPISQQDPKAQERAFQRNPLRMRLTESELSAFVTGYSMADDLFYHGVPGEVFGPWRETCRRHAWGAEVNCGVWLARVSGFARSQTLGPFEDRNRDNAEADLLDLHFLKWSQEMLRDFLPRVSVTRPT